MVVVDFASKWINWSIKRMSKSAMVRREAVVEFVDDYAEEAETSAGLSPPFACESALYEATRGSLLYFAYT